MKKLQKIFDKSRKNYADTRELDYKKAVYDSLNEKDDLQHLKILFYDATHQLNKSFNANNPHGDSLNFKRFEGYLNDPVFLTIITIDEMMGYLANLPGVYPTWYDSIKGKDYRKNPGIYKSYVEQTGLSPFQHINGVEEHTANFKVWFETLNLTNLYLGKGEIIDSIKEKDSDDLSLPMFHNATMINYTRQSSGLYLYLTLTAGRQEQVSIMKWMDHYTIITPKYLGYPIRNIYASNVMDAMRQFLAANNIN